MEQITHYYPFGGPFGDAGLNPELQPYKYNGKELDRMFGLDTYDYGARQYFPALPVWDRMDPLCEKYYHISPYNYCLSNPMANIDKDGYEVINGFDISKDLEWKATLLYINYIQDEYNAIMIFGHGNPNGIRLNYNGENKFYNNAEEFIQFLDENSEVWQYRFVLKDPIKIVLFSCETAKSNYGFPSFAQKLSQDIKDVPIYAPEAKIGIHFYEGTTEIDDNKNWKKIKNGIVVDEYKGDNVVPGTKEFNENRDRDHESYEQDNLFKWIDYCIF